MTNPLLIFMLLMIIALIGATAHYLKRWKRGQTAVSFFDYLMGEPQHTLATLGTLVGAVATLMSVGHIDILDAKTFGEVLLAGYTVDSAVNKAPDD